MVVLYHGISVHEHQSVDVIHAKRHGTGRILVVRSIKTDSDWAASCLGEGASYANFSTTASGPDLQISRQFGTGSRLNQTHLYMNTDGSICVHGYRLIDVIHALRHGTGRLLIVRNINTDSDWAASCVGEGASYTNLSTMAHGFLISCKMSACLSHYPLSLLVRCPVLHCTGITCKLPQ